MRRLVIRASVIPTQILRPSLSAAGGKGAIAMTLSARNPSTLEEQAHSFRRFASVAHGVHYETWSAHGVSSREADPRGSYRESRIERAKFRGLIKA